jgi:hypothetical protein
VEEVLGKWMTELAMDGVSVKSQERRGRDWIYLELVTVRRPGTAALRVLCLPDMPIVNHPQTGQLLISC